MMTNLFAQTNEKNVDTLFYDTKFLVTFSYNDTLFSFQDIKNGVVIERKNDEKNTYMYNNSITIGLNPGYIKKYTKITKNLLFFYYYHDGDVFADGMCIFPHFFFYDIDNKEIKFIDFDDLWDTPRVYYLQIKNNIISGSSKYIDDIDEKIYIKNNTIFFKLKYKLYDTHSGSEYAFKYKKGRKTYILKNFGDYSRFVRIYFKEKVIYPKK